MSKNLSDEKSHPNIPVFGLYELSKEEIDSISDKKTQLTYHKNETLFKQGAFASHVMYIVEGLVKVFFQTGTNKRINIQLCKAGDFLAFSSVFGNNVYYYSAQAVKTSRICMIDKDALIQILKENSDFAMHITSNNVRHEAHLLEILRTVSYKQMRGKLASALLYLTSEQFEKDDVFSCLTRQDIAEFAALTPESAIRFIKEFEKEGIINLAGKEIEINNYEALSEISDKG